MILQALTRHYEDLLALGRIPRPGWTTAKVSYALALDGDGRVIQLLHLNQQVRHGKKTVWVPQELQMPIPCKTHFWRRCKFSVRQQQLSSGS